MATLYALVYPNQATAELAAETARGLVEAGYLDVLDSTVVTKGSDGKIDHHGERHPVRRGAIAGALIGGFTGLIFAIPVLGLAAGTAFGSYIGKLTKSGAGDDFNEFREQVSKDLQPGGAALLILGQTDAPDRVLHDLGRHGGTVRSTDISEQHLKELQTEIDREASTSS
jgi:uncharacterized membrane protein